RRAGSHGVDGKADQRCIETTGAARGDGVVRRFAYSRGCTRDGTGLRVELQTCVRGKVRRNAEADGRAAVRIDGDLQRCDGGRQRVVERIRIVGDRGGRLDGGE